MAKRKKTPSDPASLRGKKRLTPRPGIVLKDPLCSQFGEIRRRRKLTQKSLVYDTRASLTTIRRVLADQPDPDRHGNPALAMHIGYLLGFAPEYVALAWMRDECRLYPIDKIGSPNAKGQRRLPEITQEREQIADALDRVLLSINPFANSGKVKRLAFRALRLELGLSRAAAARRIATKEQTTPTVTEKYLRAYEAGLALFDDQRVAAWSNALTDGGAARCEKHGRKLLDVHSLSDTLEVTQQWPAPGSRDNGPWSGTQEGLRWYATRGSSITLSRSPSIFGAMNVEILMAMQPRKCERSDLRCLNARHLGYEIAIVVNGAIRLTVSSLPFREEKADEIPSFAEKQDGVIEDRIYREGEVIQFASGLYHRCEFLEVLNRVISINLGGSILLGRKLHIPPA